MTKQIYAPYNFVPASDEVAFLEGEETFVSHDHPYEDGVSGQLTIKVTPRSLLFIGDGAEPPKFVSDPNNAPFVPGSSLRGMIRNVFEIVTFSKMSLVDDKSLSWRDFDHEAYRAAVTDTCPWLGWLCPDKETSNWVLRPTGEKLDPHNASGSKDNRIKYGALIARKGKLLNRYIDFLEGNKKKTKVNGRHVVLTAVAGKKKEEFLFPDMETDQSADIPPEVMEAFREIYEQKPGGQNKEESPWVMWKHQIKKGGELAAYPGIPVFYHTRDKDDYCSEVSSFGMCAAYRLPYTGTVRDGLPDAHNKKDALDLTEAVFGRVGEKPEDAIRSRLSFSDGHFTEKCEFLEKSVPIILAEPKPTFYPAYICQDQDKNQGNRTYKTYLLEPDGFSIRGWKRYPARRCWIEHNGFYGREGKKNKQNKMVKPLKSSANKSEKNVFKFTISFHNLRMFEFGALLYAIMLENDYTPKSKTYRHGLGMGKPLGWGQVSLDIQDVKLRKNADVTNWLKDHKREASCIEAYKNFKSWMFGKEGKVSSCAQIDVLRSMMDPDVGAERRLKYMKMDMTKKQNEFAPAKKAKLILPEYKDVHGVRKNASGHSSSRKSIRG